MNVITASGHAGASSGHVPPQGIRIDETDHKSTGAFGHSTPGLRTAPLAPSSPFQADRFGDRSHGPESKAVHLSGGRSTVASARVGRCKALPKGGRVPFQKRQAEEALEVMESAIDAFEDAAKDGCIDHREIRRVYPRLLDARTYARVINANDQAMRAIGRARGPRQLGNVFRLAQAAADELPEQRMA